MLTSGVLLVCFLVLIYNFLKKSSRLTLPGPWGVPLLGHLPRLGAHPHHKLAEWAEKYGHVYAIRLFRRNYVILNDVDLIRQAMVERDAQFAGRPRDLYRTGSATFNQGELMYQTPDQRTWRLVRENVLKTVAYHVTHLEYDNVYAEMTQQLLDKIRPIRRAVSENRHDPRTDINNYVTKMMLHLTLGKVVQEDNQLFLKVQELERLYSLSIGLGAEGSELDALPFLSLLPGNAANGRLLRGKGLLVLLWEQVRQDLSRTAPSSVQVGAVMQRLWALKDATNEEERRTIIKDMHLMYNMGSMLVTGIATLVNTMYASINILAHYPDVQSKLKEEVDAVVGNERLATSGDRSNMPYAMAATLELLRYTSIMPLGVPRATTTDTAIVDAFAAKETPVLFNLWHLHHDKMFWGDPWVYRPERFLDLRGTLLSPEDGNRKRVFPFGGGSRLCPFEDWATSRVFCFLTAVTQTYDIKFAPVPLFTLPSCDPRTYDPGQVLSPKRAMHRFVLRGAAEDAG